jgi:UDP-glucuronate decarboxylase
MKCTTRVDKIILEDVAAIAALPLEWSKLQGRNVLITGAYGFLPAYMIETILYLNESKGLDCRVTGLVRNAQKANERFAPHQNRQDLRFVEGDVVSGDFGPGRHDIVIHAASNASPKLFGTDPVGTMNANFLGAGLLLEAARKWKPDAVLYFSSGEVYGQVADDQIPISEDQYGYLDVTAPRSCYAIAKRATEALGISYLHQYGIPFKIVRPFHTYGPGMSLDDGRVFADFVRNAIRGEDIVMRSDGSAVRAFCYLSDAVAGYFTVLLRGSTGTAYNVGNTDGAMSIRALAELTVSLGRNPNASVVCEAPSPTDGQHSPVASSIPDINRIKALGWSPTVTPHNGFERTVRYYLR